MALSPANRISQISEYYFSKKLAEVRKLKQNGHPIINLGIGNPDLAPNNEAIQELHNASLKSQSHYYQSYKGIEDLRIAYSNWYKDIYKVKLNHETEILPLAGSKEGIMLTTMAFVNTGDRILIPDPGYPAYTSMSKLVDAEIVFYKLKAENNWQPDFNEIQELHDEKPIKLMWVNYPHMPTGTKPNKELFTNLVDLATKNQIIICNDNPYSLVLNENPLSLLRFAKDNTYIIELNSLSKSHNMQGLRLGMAASNEETINYLLRVKSNYDSGMYRPLQEAAVKAMSVDKSWYVRLNEIYNQRKKVIFKALDTLNCKYNKDTAGLFVWAKVPDNYTNGLELADKLLYDLNIFIAPGMIFGKGGEKYIRFSLCAPDNEINEAAQRIHNYFKNN